MKPRPPYALSFPVCLFVMGCLVPGPAAPAGTAEAAGAPTGEPTDVVARIGDHAIDRATFEAEFARSRPDTAKSELEARQEFMRSFVDRNLIAIAAREAGYFEADQNKEQLIQGYEDSILLNMIRDRLVNSKIVITPAEVDSFHARQATLFDVSQIIVATEAEAEAVKARLAAGEDFASLAREVSLDVRSADKGGQIEPFTWGVTSLAFLETFATMKPGEIRGPLKSYAGYHIFQFHGLKPNPSFKPLSEERSFVEYRYRLFREMEAMNAYYTELAERHHFAPNWPAVNELAGRFRAAYTRALTENPGASREDQEAIAKRSIVLEDSLLAEPVATWDFGRYLVNQVWQFVSQLPALAIVDRRNPHFIVGDAANEFYRAAQAKEARALGYDQEPEVRSAVERKREEIAVTEFYNRVVREQQTFTEEEERAYYEQNPERFTVEPQVKLACLQYQADAEAAAAMEAALRTEGANPDSLLKEHKTRGLIRTEIPEGRWFNETEHPILYGRAVGMKTGEVGRTIDEEGYWTVFILLEREDGHMAPFEEVRKTIQTSLRNIRAEEKLNKLLADLKTKHPVWIDPAYVPATEGTN